jgi:hypothetical protein
MNGATIGVATKLEINPIKMVYDKYVFFIDFILKFDED